MNNLLNKIFDSSGLGEYDYLKSIVDFLDGIIIPFTVVLAISAAVMALVLGIMIAKAEDAEKSKEMKKRLLGLMITVVSVTLFIWVFGFVISNFGTIMKSIRDIGLFDFNK